MTTHTSVVASAHCASGTTYATLYGPHRHVYDDHRGTGGYRRRTAENVAVDPAFLAHTYQRPTGTLTRCYIRLTPQFPAERDAPMAGTCHYFIGPRDAQTPVPKKENTMTELDRALDLVIRCTREGRLPPAATLDAIADQCRAAWRLDDDAVALAVSSALDMLRHAGNRPPGERDEAIGLAFDLLVAAMR